MEEARPPATAPARLWLRGLVGLCIATVAVSLVAYLSDITKERLLASIRGMSPAPLAFAVLGGLILMGLQSLRWWIVMRAVLPLRYTQAYRALMVGFAFNVLLPARGGDLLRVQYLGKRTGVSRAKLLGTEIVDFWSDKWGWIAAFPIICLMGTPPTWLYMGLGAFGALVVGVAVLLGVMGSGIFRSARAPAWLTNVRDGFAANSWKRLLLVETVIAPLPWLWETFVISIAGQAFGLHLSLMESFGVQPGDHRALAG